MDSLLRTCGGSEPLQVPTATPPPLPSCARWAALPSLLPLPVDATADLVPPAAPQAKALQCFVE